MLWSRTIISYSWLRGWCWWDRKHSLKRTRKMTKISASLMIQRRTPRIGKYLFIPWIEMRSADIYIWISTNCLDDDTVFLAFAWPFFSANAVVLYVNILCRSFRRVKIMLGKSGLSCKFWLENTIPYATDTCCMYVSSFFFLNKKKKIIERLIWRMNQNNFYVINILQYNVTK